MFSNDGYFPVPTMRRDLNSFPPSHSDVSYIASPPPPCGLTAVTSLLATAPLEGLLPHPSLLFQMRSARLRLRLAPQVRLAKQLPQVHPRLTRRPWGGRSRPCRRRGAPSPRSASAAPPRGSGPPP